MVFWECALHVDVAALLFHFTPLNSWAYFAGFAAMTLVRVHTK